MAMKKVSKKVPASAKKAKARLPIIRSKLELPLMAEEPDESLEGVFPVVGIGASAGGLEAFTEMLQTLPSNTGMGFVFIQHLDPKHVSLLTELLQRQTKMRVKEATDGMKVEPNHVYVIPKNTHMLLVGGAFVLTPRIEAPIPHMPIDPFLRSLAAEQRSRAVGVILSGNASDGALGMMAIKAAGGITFAQSTESSKHDGMPRSAIAAGCVDFVLAPAEIGKELGRLGRHPYIHPSQPEQKKETVAALEAMNRVLALLWKATGVDFAQYKPNTIRRRILRRMALRRVDNLHAYLAKLRSDSTELKALYEDILINVTEFFRDPESFEALKKVVFPKIVADLQGAPIRIWVPGCSSGEEVYSIAIALLEFLEEKSPETSIQIFGTDISEIALEKARSGIYSLSIIQDVPTDRLRRFFTKVDSSYQISKRVREMCVFAKQNMVKDPPFSRLDLISCRNVLIYLGPSLQKRLIPIFHYGLKPNGFLMLGSSETVGGFSELFTLVDKTTKIYSKQEVVHRKALQFPVPDRHAEETEQDKPPGIWSESEVQREADRIILGKYAPAGVVVDDELNILQFRGRVSAYLQPFPGAASLNLLKMTSEGLSSEIRKAVQKAQRDGSPERREGLRVRADAGWADLNFEVVPFKPLTGRAPRYLILFEEARQERPAATVARKSKNRPSITTLEKENARLQEESTATKRNLQSIMEEHESANEELRSANEEIQSSNEELQSTNEELETAKEELQSTNEELNTVNDELQTRNQQLAHAGNDLQNLLSSVNIPIVMLSNDLRIRRFTPVSQRALNLIPSDVGRPISDINLNLELPRLDRLLAEVIETLTPKVLEVKDLSGRSHSLRIRPYRTEDNKIEGVVMVLVDRELLGVPPEVLGDAGDAAQTAQESSSALRAFSAGLLVAQERERYHLSRELHDDLTQRLALLELNLETLQRKEPTKRHLAENLQSFREQVTALSEDLRRIAYRLHPSVLDDLGLVVATETYVRYFSEQQNIQVAFRHGNIPAIVDADAALCLYRVLQESLHNISKHSGAHTAQVNLAGIDGYLRLSVKDSGSGFDPKTIRGKVGLGLRSMEERANLLGGKFRIDSSLEGTEVVVEVPHSPQSAEAQEK
jgi:two-component system CheB/CheR fusion protein